MKRQYYIYFTVIFESPVYFPDSSGVYVFKVDKYDMTIMIRGGYGQHMQVRTEMKHNDFDEAIAIARSQIQGAISSVVYLSSARILDIRPIATIMQLSDKEGQLAQFVGPIPVRNPEGYEIDPSIVQQIIAKLNKMPDKYTYRITRGIRWFRQSLSVENPIDRFLFLWIGFEAIEPRLRDFLKLDTKKNCGVKWIENLQENKLISSETSYTELKHIRNQIVHASKKLVELEVLAESGNRVLVITLGYAISNLLGLDIDFKYRSYSIGSQVWVRLDSKFSLDSRPSDFGSIQSSFKIDPTSSIELREKEPHLLQLSESLKIQTDSRTTMTLKRLSITDRAGISPIAELEVKE